MKIALGQINPTVGDFCGNASKIIDYSHRAKAEGADLILFPELAICGYPPRDLVEKSSFVTQNAETLEDIAKQTNGIAVICGLVTPAESETGKSVMNSAALVRDGRLEFLQSKMLLPTYDVFDEDRYFAPARKQDVVSLNGSKLRDAGRHREADERYRRHLRISHASGERNRKIGHEFRRARPRRAPRVLAVEDALADV